MTPVPRALAESSAIDSSTSIKVTTQEDEWDTPAQPTKTSPTKCSLREALQAAFNPGEGDRGCKEVIPASEYVIDLTLPGTYTLTKLDFLPEIKNKIKINGKKQSITIDGGSAATGFGGDQSRTFGIFLVATGGTLILSEIVLTNGIHTTGGAIHNEGGTVIIDESKLIENFTHPIDTFANNGGAIWSTGVLRITKTLFEQNQAGMDGGAIYTSGDTIIEESAFTKN